MNVGNLPVAIGKFVDYQSPSPPVANFSSNLTQGSAPLTVQFTDQSENASGWNWIFGDGANSTEQNPIHVFSKAGNYTVNLTVINANGINSKLATIIVLPQPVLPIANFSSNVTSGIVPLSVQFIDLSKNTTSRSWNFGDGTTSTQQNPIHVYSRAGNYTVNLTASNENGTNSKLSNISVSSQKALPIANFSSNATTGYAPLSVAFTDTSTEAPTDWNWNFGDGTSNSTIKNPVHTYSDIGLYSVSLTVSNEAGSIVVTKINYIVVNSLESPVAAFSASPTSGQAPLTVSFTDKSTGSPTSWSWNFGDKMTSTDQNPIHVYQKAGKYNVILTVKNEVSNSTIKIINYITVRK